MVNFKILFPQIIWLNIRWNKRFELITSNIMIFGVSFCQIFSSPFHVFSRIIVLKKPTPIRKRLTATHLETHATTVPRWQMRIRWTQTAWDRGTLVMQIWIMMVSWSFLRNCVIVGNYKWCSFVHFYEILWSWIMISDGYLFISTKSKFVIILLVLLLHIK